MKRRLVAILSVALMLGLWPGTAAAITYTLDQQQTGTDTELQSGYTVAQTFTNHLYGPLTRIDVSLGVSSHSEELDVQGTTGDPPVPDGVNIATSTEGLGGLSMAPTWFTFTFPGTILLPGHVYAIVITPSTAVVMYGSSTDTYAGGAAYHLTAGGWTPITAEYTNGVVDYAFKTWMGAAAATPTPTHTPTPTPTHTPTHAPTASPTHAPTATPTAPATATPAASSIAPTSTLEATPTASAAASAGDGSSTIGSTDPNSGGSGGSILFLVAAIVLVLLLILLAAGGGYLIARKRPQGPAGPGGPYPPIA